MSEKYVKNLLIIIEIKIVQMLPTQLFFFHVVTKFDSNSSLKHERIYTFLEDCIKKLSFNCARAASFVWNCMLPKYILFEGPKQMKKVTTIQLLR